MTVIAKKTITFLLIFSFIFSCTPLMSHAQSDASVDEAQEKIKAPLILPDSPWYIMKLTFEKLVDWFTFGSEAKAERYLSKADERLAEMSKMIDEGNVEEAEEVLVRYKDRVKKAAEFAGSIKRNTELMVDTIETIQSTVETHKGILDAVLDTAPDETKGIASEGIDATVVLSSRVGELKETIMMVIEENTQKAKQGIKKGLEKAEDVAQEEIKKWGF